MSKIVNLTPHSISFVDPNGNPVLTVEPSGTLARVSTKIVQTGQRRFGDMVLPVTETEFGEVEGLPDPEKGTVYLVSSLVAQRCKGRGDVFIPNESVRDSEGRIVGCRSLGRV